MAGSARLHGCSSCRSVWRRGSSSPDVWPAAILRLPSCEERRSSAGERIHRHLWITVGDLGMLSCPLIRCPFCRGAYITAAYWFTASTSFANPAVTLARAASNTFAGIRPADAPAFIAVQFAAVLAGTWSFRWLVPVQLEPAEIEGRA